MKISFAADHDIPPGPNDPRITPRIIVMHTMAGFIEGAEQRFKATGLEAHLGFALDGRTWQWRDTDWQADAQGEGNDYCISFEFEDGGNCMIPLSGAQKANFYRACRELMPRYSILARLVQRTSEHGFGYHRQFPEWNPNNHACPCDIRQSQLIHELIPTLQHALDLALEPIAEEEMLYLLRCDKVGDLPPRIPRLLNAANGWEEDLTNDKMRALQAAGVKMLNLSGEPDAYDAARRALSPPVTP